MTRKDLDAMFEHPHVVEKMRRIQMMMERTEKIAQTGSWEWNVESDTVTWSKETYRFFGRDPAAGIPNLEGQRELYTPEDTQVLHATVAKALADGQPYDIELCGVRPTGETRYCRILGFPETDASGKIVRLAGSLQDITERKQAEEDLRRSQARYRLLIDSLPEAAVLLFDQSFRYQIAGGEELIRNGLSRRQVEGRTLAEVFPPDLAKVFSPLYAKALSGEKVVFEHQHQSSYYQQHVVPVRGDQGQIVAGMVISHNITERKLAEQALSEAKEGLERRVAERTRELVDARNQAEAANIAKSAFLANMSHEIRTPLNAINGMCFLTRRAGVTPQQAQYLVQAEAAGEHLLRVISDILDISRIESGKFALDVTAVDLNGIVSDAVSMLSGDALAKGLRIACELQLSLPPLLGDATRIRQALLNYMSNAIKFSSGGNIVVRGRVEAEFSDAVLVRFEVQDQGIGIAADAMAKLFTPFEQADNSLTRRYGGTGLGLAITRRLAELMGGAAGVDSVLGQGSTFWFTVRLKKAPATMPFSLVNLADGDAERALREAFAGQRILVVEDDLLNREVVRLSLDGLGLAYDLAENGEAAVAMAAIRDYALILMDMQMPKMGGIEATQRIRAAGGAGARVPIIAMTANAFGEDRERCHAAGMSDFITKPFRLEKLFETMLKWRPSDDAAPV